MEPFTFKKITAEDIYVSVLTAKRVRNAEGWEKLVPVNKKAAATGSFVMDAVAQYLAVHRGVTPLELAPWLQMDAPMLRCFFLYLTGLPAGDFLTQYRLLQAKEWLASTDLNMTEVATRCGFTSLSAFSAWFIRWTKTAPRNYRLQNRPANFRDLYSWK